MREENREKREVKREIGRRRKGIRGRRVE